MHVDADELRSSSVTSLVPAAPSVPATVRVRSAVRHLAAPPDPVVAVVVVVGGAGADVVVDVPAAEVVLDSAAG